MKNDVSPLRREDLNPRNEDNQLHGYCEVYYTDGTLYRKGNYINGVLDGPHEWYYNNGKLMEKGYFLNDISIGCHEEYFYDGKIANKTYYIR